MNELIFNGKRLSEFGAFYDSHQAFNTPERDLEYVEILGRDGDLIIDNDRFKNIEINFPCYIPTDFLPKYRNLMAYLNSQRGYKRLEYSQEPDYYRLASFAGNVEASPLQLHRAGRFTLPFICKPQRFLKSGEIPVSASSQSVSYEGNPVEIDNPSGISAVSSLAVALNPIQNLNGYDSPWIGGAGKNKLPSHAVGSTTISGVTFTVNADGTITVNGTATAEAQYAITFSNLTGNYYFGGCPSGGSSTAYELYAWDYTASARFKKWNGTTASDSDFGTGSKEISIPSGHNGSLSIRIRNGYTANNLVFKPMIRLASETDATYEPYSNICPITGHTSASVTRTGKNLLQINNNVNTYTHNGVTYTFARDSQGNLLSITADGTATGGNSFVVFSVLPNMQYLVGLGKPIKLSGAPNENGRARLQWWNYNGNGATAGDNGNGSSAFIPTSTAGNVAIQVSVNETVHNAVYKPMILLADETDRTYEPYQGQTYTIDLNGTRYGGTVDLTTGVLTVDKGYITVGDCTWTYNSSNHTFLTTSAIGKMAGYLTVQSDRYVPTNAALADMANGTIRGHATNATSVYIKDERYTDADTFKTAQADAQIVYDLATPQTVQLTAQQISLLTGINYISSSDEVTVTVSEPSLLENPTLFESKPLIRVYGHGTLIVNNQYVTIAENPYVYIDIDCDIMDAFYGANNANRYVSLPNDYITLKSGNNYIAYDGTVEITPRWFEI